MNHKNNNRSSFSGKIGFVLSAAGASVGLGNIWRFPYLAAKYGGGIFLLIYIILALTFGYSMIVAETSLGRMTGKSPVGAFHTFGKSKWLSFGGWINAIIPILIVPYYSVIGGWVIKYLVEYAKGHGHDLAADGYFSTFISNGVSTELCFIVFTLWYRARIPHYDADPGSALRDHHSLFCYQTGSTERCEVFPDPESCEFFLDDSRSCHGSDVLLSVHCHGYSHHLRLLHEKRCLH